MDWQVARHLHEKLFQVVSSAEDSVAPVTRVLDEGADPNYSNIDTGFYTTVLHSAVEARELRREKIDVLIERKCDVNILDRHDRKTALMLACDNRDGFPIVEQLLNLGADPNIISRFGWTALTEAMPRGSNAIVKLLLDRGADESIPMLKDTPGYIWSPEPDYVGSGTVAETPIVGAAGRVGDPTVAIWLLNRGANPNVQPMYRQTPLCNATGNEDMAMVEVLLERKADPNLQSSGDTISTPLLVCAKEHDDVMMAVMLIEHGADPNFQADSRHTPLCEAVAHGNLAMVQLLVDRGANLFAVNQANQTASELAEAAPKLAEVAAYLRSVAYEPRMLAFSMGLHPRLGVGSPMHQYAADTGVKDDVMPMVGRFVRE